MSVLAGPQIPMGQHVGARERDFESQRRYEAMKRRLSEKKKKSKIEDLTQSSHNKNEKRDVAENKN